MSLHDMLKGSQPVWFAEVRHIISADRHEADIDTHHRPDAEGGPYFNTVRSARRWCEAILAHLAASGIHPSDLEAVTDRGRWAWPLGRREDREFVEDEPTFSYVCRTDHARDRWQWIYDGDPSVNPGETSHDY